MSASTHFPMPREHVLRAGNTTVAVIPEIGLVSHFQVDAWAVLYRASETGNFKRWGLPLMIPNFSRLKDGTFLEKGTQLPTHGFGRNLPWTVLKQDQTSIDIQLTSSDATHQSYPYDFTFTARIEANEGTLTYTLTMENHSNEIMPITPGFHPYFTVAQQDKARIITDGPVGFAIDSFQWDTHPPNNPYPFSHCVTVHIPHKGTLLIAELPSEGKYLLATMQVWSETTDAPDYNFVCFEPVVTSEDGLNRPEDRLNIAPHATQQMILQLVAQPL